MDTNDEPGDSGTPKQNAGRARATKTPMQQQVLEASYKINQFPSEEHRRAIGDRIELTAQQVQGWFTNRRRREKRLEEKTAAASAATNSGSSPAPGGAGGAPLAPSQLTTPAVSEQLNQNDAHDQQLAHHKPVNGKPTQLNLAGSLAGHGGSDTAASSGGTAVPPTASGAAAAQPSQRAAGLVAHPQAVAAAGAAVKPPRAPLSVDDVLALIEAAKAALPVPFRTDGPPLALDFDEPPFPVPPTPNAAAGGGAAAAAAMAAAAGAKRPRPPAAGSYDGESGGDGSRAGRGRVAGTSSADGGDGGGGAEDGIGGGPTSNAERLLAAATPEEREALRRKMMEERIERRRIAEEARQRQQDDDAMGSGAGEGAPGASGAQGPAPSGLTKKQEKERARRQQEKLRKDAVKTEGGLTRGEERAQKEVARLAEKLEKERLKEESKRLRDVERQRAVEERELKRLELQREKERVAEERRRSGGPARRPGGGAAAAADSAAAGEFPDGVPLAVLPVPTALTAAVPPSRSRAAAAPIEDEALEARGLLAAQQQQQRLASAASLGAAASSAGELHMPGTMDVEVMAAGRGGDGALSRPEFPPAELCLQPAFPEEFGGDEAGGRLLMAWSFLHCFSDMIGLRRCTVGQLAEAVVLGEDSVLLAEVHTALLRMLQADMEEAFHHHMALAAVHSGTGKTERAGSTLLLEEAQHWGFDVDAWRAHLNLTTWPEVLRQFAIVAGAGQRRPRLNQAAKPKLGVEGEDIEEDERGNLKLRMPTRFAVGTMKAAAWQILTLVGREGLQIDDLARRIQRAGLRDLRTSKTPEASVAGALSRDSLFVRVAPATYALQSVIVHEKRLRGDNTAAAATATTAAAATAGESHLPVTGGKTAGGGGTPPPAQVMTPGTGLAGHEGRRSVPASPVGAAGLVAAPSAQQQQHTVAAVAGWRQPSPQPPVKTEAAAGGVVSHPEAFVKTEGGTAATAGPGAVAEVKAEREAAAAEAGEAVAGGVLAAVAASAVKADASPALGDASTGADVKAETVDASAAPQPDDEGSSSSDDERAEQDASEERARVRQGDGATWVSALTSSDYSSLPITERLAALTWLVQLAADSPYIRSRLEARDAEGHRLRKFLQDDAKAAKSSRSADAGERAAEEALARLQEFQRTGVVPPPSTAAMATAAGCTSVKGLSLETLLGDTSALASLDLDEAERTVAEVARAATRAQIDDEDRRAKQALAEALVKIDERYANRLEPLGLDRRYNRYWRFHTSDDAEVDPGASRLYIEDGSNGTWRVLSEAWQLDELLSALDTRGVREGQLHKALTRQDAALRRGMPLSAFDMPPPLAAMHLEDRASVEAQVTAQCVATKTQAQTLLNDLVDYTQNIDFPAADSARVCKIKRDMLRIESVLLDNALDDTFQRVLWVPQVTAAASGGELRNCLAQLDNAIAQRLVAPTFARRPLLVQGAWLPVGMEVASAVPGQVGEAQQLTSRGGVAGDAAVPVCLEPLAWLPPTLAAISLRLQALDAAITYNSKTCGRDYLAGYRYTLRPAPTVDEEDEARAAGGTTKIPSCKVLYGNPITIRGTTRLPQLFPILPGDLMNRAPRDFDLNVDQLRRDVAQAVADGRLTAYGTVGGTYGYVPRPRVYLPVTRQGGGAGGGGAAAAAGGAKGGGGGGPGAPGGKARALGSNPRVRSRPGFGKPGGGSRASGKGGGGSSRSRRKGRHALSSEEDEQDDYGPDEEDDDDLKYEYGHAVPYPAASGGGGGGPGGKQRKGSASGTPGPASRIRAAAAPARQPSSSAAARPSRNRGQAPVSYAEYDFMQVDREEEEGQYGRDAVQAAHTGRDAAVAGAAYGASAENDDSEGGGDEEDEHDA